MTDFDRKKHWEAIYQKKQLNEVSWYQPKPETSLHFIKASNLPKDAKIIDVGGGDSFLLDNLLDLGYSDIAILDISEKAIERAKSRLGRQASQVHWIVEDVSKFKPQTKFHFWHDRAAFHFLTDPEEVNAYAETVKEALLPNGDLVIGTFAENGPTKCSGIEIKQYSEQSMIDIFEQSSFEKIKCIKTEHPTPFDTIQNFIFCHFKRK